MFDDNEPQAPEGFLDTLEGEIALFRSIERARPVGMHKHFHMLTLRRSIRNESGVWVDVDAIWAKLATLYHLDALDELDFHQYDSATGRPIIYPNSNSPAVLHNHPWFHEFALPYAQFNDLMTARRAATPVGESEPSKPRKRHLNAGLTNDDSELSDLTEGEDDAETDAATEAAEDGAEEEGEAETEDTPTSRRGTRKSTARGKAAPKVNRGKGSKKKKK
ncbi:CT20 domain-containing protein [Ceratobasidium sp. AG-Ba]|nr:CT20 domain-containing protein [Ceratobasidium sp. AG-Ba]